MARLQVAPRDRAFAFSQLDLHDDTLEHVAFSPASGRTLPRLELTLFRHWEKRRRSLTFVGCANISLNIDIDVLASNAPSNVCGTEATSAKEPIETLVMAHSRQWNVEYENSINPLNRKLPALRNLTLFQVMLFGGNISVLAKSYRIANSKL